MMKNFIRSLYENIIFTCQGQHILMIQPIDLETYFEEK